MAVSGTIASNLRLSTRHIEVMEKKPSGSKSDRGIARIAYRIKNQKGEEVLTFLSKHLLNAASSQCWVARAVVAAEHRKVG